MQKINQLFGKRVINQSTGQGVGTVKDVVLTRDSQRIVALVVGDGSWGSSEERAVRWDGITGVGEYVVVQGDSVLTGVSSDTELTDLRTDAHQITGKSVVSTSGEKLGSVGDIFFDDDGSIVGFEITQGGMFSTFGDRSMLRASDVQAVGKDAVVATTSQLSPMGDTDKGQERGQQGLLGRMGVVSDDDSEREREAGGSDQGLNMASRQRPGARVYEHDDS